MGIIQKLKNKVAVATMQADKEIFFKDISRVVAPSTVEEFPTYIRINHETLARSIIAGIAPVNDISGYPADMSNTVIDELMALSDDGYQIAYSFSVLPIPNHESMKMLDEAIYHNKVSQQSFREKENPNKQPPLKKILEQEDFSGNYRELYRNSQKMYHTSFIITFFGKNEGQLRAISPINIPFFNHTRRSPFPIAFWTRLCSYPSLDNPMSSPFTQSFEINPFSETNENNPSLFNEIPFDNFVISLLV